MGGNPTSPSHHPSRLIAASGAATVGAPPIPDASAVHYRRDVAIPDAVRASVLRRIQSLDRTARAVLMRASVIGRRFDLRLLMATTTCPGDRVRRAIEQACDLQLLVAEDPQGERFAFRHGLTRDIIYAECLAGRIRPLHRRIATALERTMRSGNVGLEDLAYHFWAAGDAPRALLYNERAGDDAAAVHALEDARIYYARARSLVDLDSSAYLRLTEKLSATTEP
jgi:predicted ATPase